MRRKKTPVADPVRDAEKRYGCPFVRKKTVSLWEDAVTHCTTGQFAHLDQGYRRHCGPTAITNLILTLHNRYGFLEDPVPADVFSEVSQIGRQKLIYWNTDILGLLGGTYDFLTYPYIRDCLKRFRFPAGETVSLHAYVLPAADRFLQELDSGKLLYLQLHRHRCYGSHHLLCYGYTLVCGVDPASGRTYREIYLITADGWNSRPRYLRLKDRGICHFCTIGSLIR